MRTLMFILPALMSGPALAADHYELDREHTTILFFINHLGFSEMVGAFTAFDGNFMFDPAHAEESRLDVTLKPSGVRTSSETLDRVLQGERFFHTDQFPVIRFTSTAVAATGADTGTITGNLTMLGVTKPITDRKSVV